MKQLMGPLTLAVAVAALAQPHLGAAQTSTAVPPAITTPDRVGSRIGTLEFKSGMPSAATLEKVYDNLDRSHAFRAFVDTFQGVSTAAIHKGFLDIGVKDNEVLVFSTLMDANSLFLTANADTVYFVGIIDLSKGPMVLEAPPGALGTIDDMWRRWVIDFGVPGPDTPQRHPRAGSQSYPSPAAEADPDGSTTIYFGPQQPDGVKGGNWIQTMPDRGWFTVLRLYSPLEPFFTKQWRLTEIELVG